MIKIKDQIYVSKLIKDEEAKMLLSLLLIKDEKADNLFNSMIESKHFPVLLIEKRCEAFKIKLNTKVKIFGCIICDNPGKLVCYMVDVLSELGEEATLEKVIEKLYPEGFYSQKGFEERWVFLEKNKKEIPWTRIM